MDLAIIERLMQLLQNSDVNELEVTEGNLRISMSKSVAGAAAMPAAADATPDAGANAPIRTTGAREDEHRIVAGLPGTFYRAPSPDAEPFVSVGDRITDGQQVAIVEAMKMMNPVEADCDGEIVEILVEDAAPVVAGTPLFSIRRSSP